MDEIFLWNRWLHMSSGFVSFFVAPLAMATAKGGVWHRRWGKVFFWAMLVSACSAILSAWYRSNLFLLLTGVFAIYLAWLGYRALDQKKLPRGQAPARRDWFASGLGLLIFTFFAGYGLRTGNVVALIFGGLGAWTAFDDLRKLRRAAQLDRLQWFFDHMRGFCIAYIAAVSAFSATQIGPFLAKYLDPGIARPIAFLWPTVVGTPLLAVWVRRYKARFARGAQVSEVATVREPVA